MKLSENPTLAAQANNPLAGMRAQSGSSNFTAGNQSATTPTANPSILWGAAASALLGASLAEWQRKRDEEKARLVAMRNSGGGGGEDEGPGKKKSPGRTAYEKMMQQKHIIGALQAEKTRQAKAEARDEETFMQKTYQKILNAANVIPGMSAWRENQQEQARQNDVYAARWAGVAQVEQAREQADRDRANAAYAARWAGLAQFEQAREQAARDRANAAYAARWAGVAQSEQEREQANRDRANAAYAARWRGVVGQYQSPGERVFANAQALGLHYSPEMKTYMIASINVQSTGSDYSGDGNNAHLGDAQLSRNELDTPYKHGFDDDGNPCERECRGYGLGLKGEDPKEDKTAALGMHQRIQQVLDKAENLSDRNNIVLTNTDLYIIVAMAQNGGGFDLDDVQNVMAHYVQDGAINWEAYFDYKQNSYNKKINEASWLDREGLQILGNNIRTDGKDYDTKFILQKFLEETSKLEDKGYALPEDLDIERIKDLIARPIDGAASGGGQ